VRQASAWSRRVTVSRKVSSTTLIGGGLRVLLQLVADRGPAQGGQAVVQDDQVGFLVQGQGDRLPPIRRLNGLPGR
jgi:hypothetical protein